MCEKWKEDMRREEVHKIVVGMNLVGCVSRQGENPFVQRLCASRDRAVFGSTMKRRKKNVRRRIVE